jgi:hypothetical protein
MMSTVYIVTSGEYERYQIHATFTDKALAEQYATLIDRESVLVEEWPVLTELPTPAVWYVAKWWAPKDDFYETKTETNIDGNYPYGQHDPYVDVRHRATMLNPHTYDVLESVTVYSQDRELAERVLREKVTEIKDAK